MNSFPSVRVAGQLVFVSGPNLYALRAWDGTVAWSYTIGAGDGISLADIAP
jgi:outer membrane protein assembly factor BamB